METCSLCGKTLDSLAHVAEQWVIDNIRSKNPEWVSEDGACEPCIDYYRALDDAVEVVEPLS